jgi:YesN/AraC family two-component response regulator
MWKVAIFDDNQVVVDALCRSIDWKSINCSICGVASNGTDALAVINNAQPNIVITDILMPGFSASVNKVYHYHRIQQCKICAPVRTAKRV